MDYEAIGIEIQAAIDEWIAGPPDDRKFSGIVASVLRAHFPEPQPASPTAEKGEKE